MKYCSLGATTQDAPKKIKSTKPMANQIGKGRSNTVSVSRPATRPMRNILAP